MIKSFEDLKQGMSRERLESIYKRIDDIYESLKRSGTPCVGICSTVYGDEICIGCMRTYKEVINWNVGLDEDEKQSIIDRYKKLEEEFKDEHK